MSRKHGKLVSRVETTESHRVANVPAPDDFCNRSHCDICFHNEVETVFVDAWSLSMCSGGLMTCGSGCTCVREDIADVYEEAQKENARREALRERMTRYNARKAAGKAHYQAMLLVPANAVREQLAAFKARHADMTVTFGSLLTRSVVTTEHTAQYSGSINEWIETVAKSEPIMRVK